MIEHLEPRLSDWLLMEYSSASRIVGRENLLITNVRSPGERARLSTIAKVRRERAFRAFRPRDLVILDPLAEMELDFRDLEQKRAVVIGGILGDDPPQGRTGMMLTRLAKGAAVRNIGPHQFSIDGAAYVAKLVWEGKRLEDIPVKVGVEVELGPGHSVVLPYAYPLVGDKPLLPRGLISYLRKPWNLKA
ncbi:MAG: SAM-dependent methyltransferase [Candidatus Hadarchaeales archaeon]